MGFARRKRNSLKIALLIKFLLKDWKEHAEADCFFCFTNLMSDIRDFFIKVRDSVHANAVSSVQASLLMAEK